MLGVIFLGSVAISIDGPGGNGAAEIEVQADVPAGSYIRVVYHYHATGYALVSWTDDAGNDYSNFINPGRAPNCLPLAAGQKIYASFPHLGWAHPNDGAVLLAWAYAITGNGVQWVGGHGGISTPFDIDGTFDGVANLSVGPVPAPSAQVLLGIADAVSSSSAAPPSITADGWDSGGGLADGWDSPDGLHGAWRVGVVASRIVAEGDPITWSAALSYDGPFIFGISWEAYAETVVVPGENDISQARTPGTGALLVAHTDAAGTLRVDRYDSSLPPEVAASVTLEAEGVTGVSLVAHLMGNVAFHEVLYAHLGDIKRRISRDGGRNWSVATTIASGYQDVAHVIDPTTGLAVAALWKESEKRWYLAIGQRPGGTGDHSYTVVGTLANNARRGGSLIRTAGRRFEFAYRTTNDVLTIIRCAALNASGGDWS